MTTNTLPQVHCSRTDDHPVHDYWAGKVSRANRKRCPGRHTPTELTSGAHGNPRPPEPFEYF